MLEAWRFRYPELVNQVDQGSFRYFQNLIRKLGILSRKVTASKLDLPEAVFKESKLVKIFRLTIDEHKLDTNKICLC